MKQTSENKQQCCQMNSNFWHQNPLTQKINNLWKLDILMQSDVQNSLNSIKQPSTSDVGDVV